MSWVPNNARILFDLCWWWRTLNVLSIFTTIWSGIHTSVRSAMRVVTQRQTLDVKTITPVTSEKWGVNIHVIYFVGEARSKCSWTRMAEWRTEWLRRFLPRGICWICGRNRGCLSRYKSSVSTSVQTFPVNEVAVHLWSNTNAME